MVKIIDIKSGKEVSCTTMCKDLATKDVVFFGEYRDQDILHKVEAEVFQELYNLKGNSLVLSLEMFEADNQDRLNSYLANTISEEDFLKDSRPWSNYKTDYRPLVELAKAHKLPVLAANVPGFLATHLAKNNTLEEIEVKYKKFLPAHTYAPEGKYKDKFMTYMTQGLISMNRPPIPAEKLLPKFAAQCLIDDKMAESIFAYREAHGDALIMHINGCFHSDARLGMVEKFKTLAPKAKTAVLTPKFLPADGNFISTLEVDKEDGDYIIYFSRAENIKVTTK